jgi:hypothetical protein
MSRASDLAQAIESRLRPTNDDFALAWVATGVLIAVDDVCRYLGVPEMADAVLVDVAAAIRRFDDGGT